MDSEFDHAIAVVGLGYVGLPVAIALSRRFKNVIGYDTNPDRIGKLQQGFDWSGDIAPEQLQDATVTFTSHEKDLQGRRIFIICVPTPITQANKPDLSHLIAASRAVGRAIRPDAIICFESTVYPGATEAVCGPAIATESGLRQGVDFKLGYSPERINPGDREHTFERISKIVAAEDDATAETLCALYGAVVTADIHRAPSIQVAEAAKVIENTQRDLNIALMNELALIFDRMGIRTKDVLAAAGTKWNFLKFSPGLVGGHCIGVDPYYLTSRAEEFGYTPEVILAGRRINDEMGLYVARKMIEFLCRAGKAPAKAKVGILGVTFKEDVTDVRNSRVPDIYFELERFGVMPILHDPVANPDQVASAFGIHMAPDHDLADLDGLILAVPHQALVADLPALYRRVKPNGYLIDVKAALEPSDEINVWSL